MSPENTVAPPTSQKRIDANRKNAQRSTGPRTPEGKSRSRFNGLQHGLAATVPVLPGEDPAAFQARVDAVMDSFAPQNQVEVELLERVAATSLSLDRATRAEVARLSHKIRHDAIEREQRENEEAVALGQRLLWSARGPWQLYPHSVSMGLKWERRISWSENPADPNNPALLVTRLERTVAGCRWLLDRWAELWARLEPGEVCVAPDQFKATRLLGKQPLDAVDDPEVTQIFTASFELLPDGQNGKAFAPLERELMANRHEDDVYNKELRRRQLPKLKPPDADAVREVLKALVDRQTSRLKLILRGTRRSPRPTPPRRRTAWPLTPAPKAKSCAAMCCRPRDWSTRRSRPICPLSVVPCPLRIRPLSLVLCPLYPNTTRRRASRVQLRTTSQRASRCGSRGPGCVPAGCSARS